MWEGSLNIHTNYSSESNFLPLSSFSWLFRPAKFWSQCLCKVHSCPSICALAQEQLFACEHVLWEIVLYPPDKAAELKVAHLGNGNDSVSDRADTSHEYGLFLPPSFILTKSQRCEQVVVVHEQGLQVLLWDFLLASLQQARLSLIFFTQISLVNDIYIWW